MSIRKPILVTGSHRSGTTWVGKMLAKAPRVGYIHEPFNFTIAPVLIDDPFPRWFQFISEENENDFVGTLERTINFKYPLWPSLVSAGSSKVYLKIVRDQLLFWKYRLAGYTPLVKDPIALFSSAWLAKTFNMNVCVMIRHPAAFCSSLKIKGWTFDFQEFLKQPLLMKNYLARFQLEIEEYADLPHSNLDQAILLWNCIHHTISQFKNDYSEWLFVRHEDLSRDPVSEFAKIFGAFDLDFSDAAKKKIEESSGAHNPVEQQKGNEFIRNSKENIYNWKNRLTDEEIQLIKTKTSQISPEFYTNSEW